MTAPTAPAPGVLRAILIDNNAIKTNSSTVDLILSAEGVIQMLVSNASDFAGAIWEDYVTAKEWTLLDEEVGPGFGDGTKTVFVKFRNSSLEETAVHSASITLDTQPPVVGPVPIMINGGAITTNSRQATLTFDVEGATSIEVFNENELDTFAEGTTFPFNTNLSWTLSEDNGVKRVLVVFIDDIGNRSSFFSDRIILTDQAVGNLVITEPIDGTVTTDHFIAVKGTGNPGSKVQIDISGEV